jgi:hypothetical protein
MAKRPTLLQHFRSFAYQNGIKDMDTALAYFSVFGGTGWEIDTSEDIEILIEEKILRNYASLHESMTRYTHNNPVYHRLLSIVALGTEHEHEAFKKAKIGRDRGEDAVDYLEKKRLLTFDLTAAKPLSEQDEKSDRLLFMLPFMRFWFAMISPHYRNIAKGDYREFRAKWQQAKANFSILLSNLLIRELVRQHMADSMADDPIVSIGTYYDKRTWIEILATRKSGKLLAGACKYSQEVAKPNMLNTLRERCTKAELNVTDYVLFSRNGFSSEVEAAREANVTLLSGSHLASLLDGLGEDDRLVYTNRQY